MGGNALGRDALGRDALGLDALALNVPLRCRSFINQKLKAKGGGKFTKPPYQPGDPGKYADSSDPSTWGTFAEAFANV
jgi:hypothetical protein